MMANVRQSATFTFPRFIWRVIKSQAQSLNEGKLPKAVKPKGDSMMTSFEKLLGSQVELMVGKHSDL